MERKAKKIDTPDKQTARALAMLAEHSEAVVVLAYASGVVNVSFNGAESHIRQLLVIGANMDIPSGRTSYSATISPPPTHDEGDGA